jgi:biotin transport system substrate-specific component
VENKVESTVYKARVIPAAVPAGGEASGWITLTALSLLFAGFTGLCAQLRFYLPFTPVPVTGQVFAVLLCGIFIGKK